VILVTLASKGLGYVREAVVAAVFGTSATVDIYLAAVAVPAAVGTVISYAIPNAFVPLFTAGGAVPSRARRAAWGVLSAMAAASILAWMMARPLARITAAGFSAAEFAATVSLLRVGAWVIALATIEALGRSRLWAQKRFVLPGLAYFWQGAAVIIAVLIWPEYGARALIWGYTAGTGAAAIWNLILGARAHVTAPPVLPANAEESGTSTGWWVAAVLLTDTIAQAFAIVDRNLGSYLASGSIAALQYANLLAFLPFSIVGMGLATAVFPFLSEATAARDGAEVALIIDRAVRWSLLVIAPVVLWFVLFREEIVTLLFQRGAFGLASRHLTGTALAVFSLGLVPNVLGAIWARAFYASRRWQPILYGSLLGLATKAVCGWWWVQSAGVAGLAAATAVAYVVWLVPLVAMGGTWVSGRAIISWGWLTLRLWLVVGIPGVLVILLWPALQPAPAVSSHLSATLRLGAAVILGLLCLVLIGRRWRLREVELASSQVIHWLRRRGD